MKHVQMFALTMVMLVPVSAGPLPPSLKDTRLVGQNATEFQLPHNNTRENFILRNCPLSTCAVNNLGSRLQGGDEAAGDATRDSDGFGKK